MNNEDSRIDDLILALVLVGLFVMPVWIGIQVAILGAQ